MTAKNKFVCLCYYDTARHKAWTPAEQAAVPAACAPHDRALRESGKVVLTTSLGEPDAARVIRPTADGKVVSSGAYARSDDQLGALFVVEASDLDEAVRIASLHPSANLGKYFGGGIEVRAFDHFELSAGTSG